MPDIEKGSVLPKKMLPIIYVIDTSGSMSGARIASVNEAMHDCEKILKEKAEELADAEIKIGALKFSSGAQWITKSGFVSLGDFYWNDVQAGGVTDLGEALKELDRKLSRNEFLISETGYCVPVIIFMSDGGPTDDWKKGVSVANSNKWYSRARKIAIAIGEDADIKVLAELVGNSEAVIRTDNVDTLKDLIVRVSVTSSMLAGSSRMAGDQADGAKIVEEAVDQMKPDEIITYEEPSNDNGSDSDDSSTDIGWDDTGW